jgi:hypothetical protein
MNSGEPDKELLDALGLSKEQLDETLSSNKLELPKCKVCGELAEYKIIYKDNPHSKPFESYEGKIAYSCIHHINDLTYDNVFAYLERL